MLFSIAIFIFLLAATVPFLCGSERQVRVSGIISAVAGIAGIVYLVAPALFGGLVTPAGNIRIEGFSALLVCLVCGVYLAAAIVSYRYIGVEHAEGILTFAQVRLYYGLLPLFVLAMVVSLLADHILMSWIALEGTTLATTMLVAMYKKDAAIEAAWKYIILCATGLSVGLLGIFLVRYAGISNGVPFEAGGFTFSELQRFAPQFDAQLLRIGFVLIFVGLGTKVGLVPMHAWLPDAHSKTPSPISAMLSGVLLNVAFFGVVRWKKIVDGGMGAPDWTNSLFLTFGLLSAILPSFTMLLIRNYKRMLAYSSIEHMGLATFAFGLGPAGAIAGAAHLIGHSLCKSLLFFGAGEILLRYKSTKINNIKNMLKRAPYTAVLFMIGILAILAIPPSPLFASEYLLLRAGFSLHPFLTMGVLMALVLTAFGMVRVGIQLALSESHEEAHPEPPSREGRSNGREERWNLTHTILLFQLAVAIAVGIWLLSAQGQGFLSRIAGIFLTTHIGLL